MAKPTAESGPETCLTGWPNRFYNLKACNFMYQLYLRFGMQHMANNSYKKEEKLNRRFSVKDIKGENQSAYAISKLFSFIFVDFRSFKLDGLIFSF